MSFRQHHSLNGHESEQTPGDNGGQRSLECCSPWGHKACLPSEDFPKGAPRGHSGRVSLQCRRPRFDPLVGKIPGTRSGNSLHRQRSLEGYSPWGRKESDMTERLYTHAN